MSKGCEIETMSFRMIWFLRDQRACLYNSSRTRARHATIVGTASSDAIKKRPIISKNGDSIGNSG